MAEPFPVLAGACAVPSRPHLSTLTRMGSGRNAQLATLSKYANFASSLPMSGEETVSILMPFLPEENRGDGPERLMVNGRQLVWRMRYRNCLERKKTLPENKAELDRFAADLQSAIQRDSNSDVCTILRAIMHWGGVDNKHRQKRTFEWIERNAGEISAKLSNASI
jgi:hypothetical protein